jgi:hypothetical protein
MRSDRVSDPTMVREPVAGGCALAIPATQGNTKRKNMTRQLDAFIGVAGGIKNQ